MHLFEKIKSIYIFIIYLFIPIMPMMANESKFYQDVDMLVKSCYKDIDSCNKTLSRIYNYQKDAARNKKFACQTRLLGLEANLIMAMNSSLKKKDAKSIILAMKKYC